HFSPSYQMPPKLETQIVCFGRDELCHEVLSNTFAPHLIWVSEENLHESEEDHFKLHFNLKAAKHTIALLDPITKQISKMVPKEPTTFYLPSNFRGRLTNICRCVPYKLYDTGVDVHRHENLDVSATNIRSLMILIKSNHTLDNHIKFYFHNSCTSITNLDRIKYEAPYTSKLESFIYYNLQVTN
ncbi:Paired amphipathic helix protein Sin3a, partial [Massospora cicadina]